ncbi:hypothetical protein AJ80_08740 [Polytolypa hystricis UAMH7299]|uniref:Uncharacterized protein n=1 Tax=Polytolypa hystricis (strain UAMH7299) TaxID=1447883 RepID=A0A2B7WUS7_POLH7|nr:hypothetical protein AJ80_08740 [Polytolypa hystricis UAMH7299]
MAFREKMRRVFSRPSNSSSSAAAASSSTPLKSHPQQPTHSSKPSTATTATTTSSLKLSRFRSKKSKTNSTNTKNRKIKPKIEIYKPHELPRSKYRGPFDEEHIQRLAAYSIPRAQEERPRSMVSEFSPMGTRAPPTRRGSVSDEDEGPGPALAGQENAYLAPGNARHVGSGLRFYTHNNNNNNNNDDDDDGGDLVGQAVVVHHDDAATVPPSSHTLPPHPLVMLDTDHDSDTTSTSLTAVGTNQNISASTLLSFPTDDHHQQMQHGKGSGEYFISPSNHHQHHVTGAEYHHGSVANIDIDNNKSKSQGWPLPEPIGGNDVPFAPAELSSKLSAIQLRS